MSSTYLATYLLRGQEISGLLTLSNRTIIWIGLFNIVAVNGYYIYGAGPFTAVESIQNSLEGITNFITITIDNSFLELWLESGLLSLILFVILLVKCARYYWGNKQMLWLYSFLVYRGLFTSSLLLSSNFLFLVLLCLPIYEKKNHYN
jgi:hypothetical protein